MKLGSDQLASHLSKSLAPLYVLAGDEPLLVDEALEAIRDAAHRGGCGERDVQVAERSFDWDGFAAGLQNMSLFSSRRLVELRLPTGKPGESGARFFTALAGRPDTGNVIVVISPALDSATARSKWATALAGAAVWVDLRPPRREQLPAWLGRRLQKAKLTADDESLDLLASLVEGNLLAAQQEIDKLALLAADGRVTTEAIRESVADGARFDVFQLSDAALAQDTARAVRVLRGLEREGESDVLVLWSLTRDILTLAGIVGQTAQGRSLDQAMNDLKVWRNRQDLFRAAAQGRSLRDIRRLVASAARVDLIAKGARQGDPWNALHEVVLGLCGVSMPLAETA